MILVADMDVFEAKYTQVQIAQATGIPIGKLRVWFNRGHVRYAESDGDERGEIGLSHRLSARTALRVAIMDAISPLIDPSRSSDVVSQFMDHGSAHPGKAGRLPGGLYEDGETHLLVTVDGKAHVVCIEADTIFGDLPPVRDGDRFAAFPMDDLYHQVCGRLEHMLQSATESHRTRKRKEKIDA